MILSLLFATYLVGWLAGSVIATRHWYREFNENGIGGATWGCLVGLLWPIAFLPYAVMRLARRGL